MYEMYGADSYGYTGNENLNPEESLNREIGAEWSNNKFTIEVSAYDTDIKNMIKYANSTYSNDKDGSSSMQGLDLKINYIQNNFEILNSYSHVHAVDSSKVWLKRRPHDSLYSTLRYYFNNWLISPTMMHFGDHSDTHSTNYSTIQIKNRTIFDMLISKENLKLEIKNIFNDLYERPHGYNQGQRNFQLSYYVNF